jgi:sucrose phosphorylase
VVEGYSRVRKHLIYLYGEARAEKIWSQVQDRLIRFTQTYPQLSESKSGIFFDQKDAVLITYGDQISSQENSALYTLGEFLEDHIGDTIPCIHILPFFPYSSDDGFSVIDYRQVDANLGTWEDVSMLGESYRLMFDVVINHVSRDSEWFQAFLRDEFPYKDYFITCDPHIDLSDVTRPRDLPLLTPVETSDGTRHVWTTFSEDQIDLNFENPQVLLEIIDLLLFYIEKGARLIRLDAIAYLWKEIGTTCIHLPQVHSIVKLLRAVLDAAAPETILITETNVPHEENVSYFGSQLPGGELGDEANMVYQFSLAPLVLHTFLTGSARAISFWCACLSTPFPNTTFFNFIASHDGIGVRPAEGLLDPQEVQALVDRTIAHGGHVSYKSNSDGSSSVYELNISLFDALNDPSQPDTDLDVQRFLASQAIMLSLAGVPGIYVHSLFGSRNAYSHYEKTGRARSINREKFQRKMLENALTEANSRTAQVFNGYTKLLNIRADHPAFHPNAPQRVLAAHENIFALHRTAGDGSETILCLVNVTDQPQTFELKAGADIILGNACFRDLIRGEDYAIEQPLKIHLAPYQTLWLLGVSCT